MAYSYNWQDNATPFGRIGMQELGLYVDATPLRSWKPGKVWIARDGIHPKIYKCLSKYAPFESSLEALAHLHLSVDQRIKCYACQPHKLQYWMPNPEGGQDKHEYTPDFVALTKDRRLLIIDAKASRFATDEKWTKREPFIRAAYREEFGAAHIEAQKFIHDFNQTAAGKKYCQVAPQRFLHKNGTLAAPSISTLRREISQKLSPFVIQAGRVGKHSARRKFTTFQTRTLPERPYQEVEIDFTPMDVILVAESGALLGRPHLVALLDRATRMVLGFSVTFDVPTYAAVMEGIKHATYRKEISHIDGLNDHDWPCMGRIESLFIDNGLEFANTHLRTAAAQLGFQICRLPPREPWLKGLVERFMGEAARFAHRLPGTTHSNAVEHRQYEEPEPIQSLGGFLMVRVINKNIPDTSLALTGGQEKAVSHRYELPNPSHRQFDRFRRRLPRWTWWATRHSHGPAARHTLHPLRPALFQSMKASTLWEREAWVRAPGWTFLLRQSPGAEAASVPRTESAQACVQAFCGSLTSARPDRIR